MAMAPFREIHALNATVMAVLLRLKYKKNLLEIAWTKPLERKTRWKNLKKFWIFSSLRFK